MLPNLVIIGAARAGTTTLHHYLSRHPRIAMSRVKELRFFSHDDRWSLGPEWYATCFADAPVRGEASPSYTASPRFPHAAERMAQLIPDAVLVYLVRDPVERALSNYQFARADGRETLPPREALLSDDSRYIAQSRYGYQLEPYRHRFAEHQIIVLDQRDLQRDPASALAPLYRRLSLEPPSDASTYRVRLNESEGQRQRGRAARWLARLNDTAVVQSLPLSWRLRAGRLLYRPFTTRYAPAVIDADLRAALADRLADDAAHFRESTGLAFSHWSV